MGEISRLVATAVLSCAVGIGGTLAFVRPVAKIDASPNAKDAEPAGRADETPLKRKPQPAAQPSVTAEPQLVSQPSVTSEPTKARRNVSPRMQQRNEFDKRIQELIRSGDGNEAYRLMTTRWASLDLSASDREDRNDRRIMIMTFRDLAEIDDRAGVFLNSITQDAVGRYVALGRNVDFQLAMDVAGQVHDSDALLELFQQAHVNGNKQHQNKGWFFFATMARAPNADIMIDLVPDLPARAESWAQAANRQLEIQRTSPNYRAVESVTRSQRQTALWRARGLDDMADAYDRRGDFDTAATLRRNARTMREAFEQL